MNRIVIFWILLLIHLVAMAQGIIQLDEGHPSGFWVGADRPVTFRLGWRGPLHATDTSSSDIRVNTEYLKNIASEWQVDSSPVRDFLQILNSCVRGDFPSGPNCSRITTNPLGNDKNEIHFNYWTSEMGGSNRLAITRTRLNQFFDTPTPGAGRVKFMEEADIHFNWDHKFTASGETGACNQNNWIAYDLASVFRHELGHALGIGNHANPATPAAVMHPAIAPCTNKNLSTTDFSLLADLYGTRQTVNVDVTSPRNGQIILAGEQIDFSATASQVSTKEVSLEGSLGSLPEIQWLSSLDGPIGIGNTISLPVLTPGQHIITARVGNPDTDVFGENAVGVEYVDSAQTSQGGVFHPLPCSRFLDRLDNACLLTLTETWQVFDCANNSISNHSYIAVNEINNQEFDMHVSLVETGFDTFSCTSGDWFDYPILAWIQDVDDIVDLSITHTIERLGTITNIAHYTTAARLVTPTISVQQLPNTCQANPITARCSVTFVWSEHFWAPNSGLFYRNLNGNDWSFLTMVGTQTGSYETPDIISAQGVEFAIFQYSDDVKYSPAIRGGPKQIIINAPAGMIAGPYQISAVQSSNPSGLMTSDNNPCAITIGETYCSVDLNATKSDTPWACIWVPDTLQINQCFSASSINTTWDFANASCCDMVLKAHDIRPFDDPRWGGAGSIGAGQIFNEAMTLDTLAVRGAVVVEAAGSLGSNNNPCTIPTGEVHCSVDLNATKSDTPWACIWVPDTLQINQCFSASSMNTTWDFANASCCDMILKAHDIRPLDDPRWGGAGSAGAGQIFNEAMTLDTLAVRGAVVVEAAGSLGSNNNPCTIPTGEVHCSVDLNATKSDTPWACIWVPDTLQINQCFSASSMNTTWDFANASCCDMVLKAHDIRPFDDPRWGGAGSAGAGQIFNEAVTLDALSVRGQ